MRCPPPWRATLHLARASSRRARWICCLLATLFVASSTSGGELVRTYSGLKKSIADKPADVKYAALRRFARDSRVALGARIAAANSLSRQLERGDRRQINARLLQARLYGLDEAWRRRRQRLRMASAWAGRARDSRAEAITAMLEGDDSLTRIIKAAEQRAGQPPSTLPTELAADVEVLERALPIYKRTGDLPQNTRGRLWLARLRETTPVPREELLSELADLVRAGGRDRDTAHHRRAVRRARARLLIELGRDREAAHESLVADRVVVVPLRSPAFDAPSPSHYSRSRETMVLCFQLRALGVSCAEIERETMDRPSYYDFSREPRAARFSPKQAAMVLAEYETLLHRCITEAASAGHIGGGHLQLEWTVGNEGRIRRFTVKPSRFAEPSFESCLDDAFALFRYPPYRGQLHHTSLGFDIDT